LGGNSPKILFQKIEKGKKEKKITWCLLGGGWGWGIFINCKSWVIIKMLCGWLFMQILTYISPQTFIHSSRRNFSLEELLQIVCQNEYLQV